MSAKTYQVKEAKDELLGRLIVSPLMNKHSAKCYLMLSNQVEPTP